MTSAKTFQVHIQRYDPDREPPCYTQMYQVDFHPSMTVLEVLELIQQDQDSSLAFRSSCRSSKCGTCAVLLNNKPVLACREVLDGGDITLAALPKLPIVRDLVVSQQEREQRLEQIAVEQPRAVALPESKVDYANVSRCIECTICTAACPVGYEMDRMEPRPDLLSSMIGAGIPVSQGEGVPVEGNIDHCSLCLCFNSYSYTQPAKDTVMLLDRLGVHVAVPQQQCCGMPMVGNGDLDGARRRAEANLASFLPWLEQGYDVVAACTTGSLMLKEEYTGTLGLRAAEALASRAYDLGEYLRILVEDGLLELSKLKPVPERMSYHTPCHLKAQRIGKPFVELLERIPGMQIEVLDTICCGLSGSYGLKNEKHDLSLAVGQHLLDALAQSQPDLAVSECGPCQLRMRRGTGLPTKHPVSILWQAFDEDPLCHGVQK
ncbi:MAG: 2Fe-2S iron-sulfur cluster binding domain-containing protein [Chloroflexi bacterium]|nr:2Fe-2S iron-sulfur cluster binding domain-containing protein [Chloroflexota bacterium]